MKVLAVTSWYPHPESPGEGVFVHDFSKIMTDIHQVEIFAFHVFDSDFKGEIGKSIEEVDGITVHRLRSKCVQIPKLKSLKINIEQVDALKAYFREFGYPDIIHCHHYNSAVPVRVAIYKQKTPYIVSEYWSGFHRGIVNSIDVHKVRFAFNGAYKVITISDFMKKQLISKGVKNNFEVIGGIIDNVMFYPSPVAISNSRATGTLTTPYYEHKGILVLADAALKLKQRNFEFNIDVIGDGPLKPQIEKFVVENGLTGKLNLLGRKPKPEIAELLRKSEYSITPSLGETFSISTAEALASGLPMIASDCTALPNLVNESNGILFEVNNSDTLADAIIRMSDEYGKYDKESLAAPIREKNSVEYVHKRFNAIYEQATTKK